jgi:putative glutamine amidotransferase
MREVIEAAGGVAVVIPHSDDPDSWQVAYDFVDAVVMMGGPDVSPDAYGATAHPLTRPGPPGCDTTELGLARACLRDGKPVLGICRGSQVLNVVAGGTLIQDVPSTGTKLVHMGEWVRVVEDPPSCSHEIEVLAGTRLAGWLGAGRHVVNSYHHQAVDLLGEGLRTSAVAPDGTIEATESTNGAFAVGLQWHNEFHMRGDERFAAPLQALVGAARENG